MKTKRVDCPACDGECCTSTLIGLSADGDPRLHFEMCKKCEGEGKTEVKMPTISDAKVADFDAETTGELLDILSTWVLDNNPAVISIGIAENTNCGIWYATITYK